MNVRPGPFKWVSWWMSFLNFQIEHHLFPCMPQVSFILLFSLSFYLSFYLCFAVLLDVFQVALNIIYISIYYSCCCYYPCSFFSVSNSYSLLSLISFSFVILPSLLVSRSSLKIMVWSILKRTILKRW